MANVRAETRGSQRRADGASSKPPLEGGQEAQLHDAHASGGRGRAVLRCVQCADVAPIDTGREKQLQLFKRTKSGLVTPMERLEHAYEEKDAEARLAAQIGQELIEKVKSDQVLIAELKSAVRRTVSSISDCLVCG